MLIKIKDMKAGQQFVTAEKIFTVYQEYSGTVLIATSPKGNIVKKFGFPNADTEYLKFPIVPCC